jgi:hypothetical protein
MLLKDYDSERSVEKFSGPESQGAWFGKPPVVK